MLTVQGGKIITLNVYIIKGECSQVSNLSFYLMNPGSEEQIKLIARRKKKKERE